MRAIDIHAHMVPQALWRAADAGQEWLQGLESLTREEKDLILWKN